MSIKPDTIVKKYIAQVKEKRSNLNANETLEVLLKLFEDITRRK